MHLCETPLQVHNKRLTYPPYMSRSVSSAVVGCLFASFHVLPPSIAFSSSLWCWIAFVWCFRRHANMYRYPSIILVSVWRVSGLLHYYVNKSVDWNMLYNSLRINCNITYLYIYICCLLAQECRPASVNSVHKIPIWSFGLIENDDMIHSFIRHTNTEKKKKTRIKCGKNRYAVVISLPLFFPPDARECRFELQLYHIDCCTCKKFGRRHIMSGSV